MARLPVNIHPTNEMIQKVICLVIYIGTVSLAQLIYNSVLRWQNVIVTFPKAQHFRDF